MSVNVATGQVWIPGTLGGTSAVNLTNLGNQSAYGLPTGLTTQGSYYSINDATVNLAISAANATNPRIDLVVASVQDAFYSGSTNTVVLQVVTGTPAPSPVAPAPPANSVVLAQVAVAANATSITSGNITDKRPILGLGSGRQVAGHATQTIAQSIPNAALTTLTNMSADFLYGGITFASNVFTVPAGVYLCVGSVEWTNNNSAGYQTLLIKNGAQVTAVCGSLIANPSTASLIPIFADLVICNANDTLGLGVYQTAGVAVSTSAVNSRCRLAVIRLSI